MPTIKRWQPTVEVAPAPVVQPIPQNWTGITSIAKSLSTTAEIVSNVQDKAQQEEDDSIFAAAQAELGNGRIEIEKAVATTKGEAALKRDLTTESRAALAAQAQKVRDSLPERLQGRFDKYFVGQDEGLHRAAASHVIGQSEEQSKNSHQATVANATDIGARVALRLATTPPDLTPGAAPQSITSDREILSERQRVVEASQARQRKLGLAQGSPEALMFERADLSAYHLGVLNSLTDSKASGAASAATAYLARFGGEIDAVARSKSKIDDVVAGVNLADRSRAEADRIWALAGGDPARAVALARENPDTPMADAVEKRVKTRASDDHSLQTLADSPKLGRLEQRIYRAGGLDRTSPDYTSLSDEGKAIAENKARAQANTQKALNTEERRLQAAEDERLRKLWTTLSTSGAPGEDQASVDVMNGKLFSTGSETVRLELQGHQRKVKELVAKDGGVGLEAFKVKTTALADRLKKAQAGGKWNADRVAGFTKQMNDEYISFMVDPANGKREPKDSDVQEMYKRALQYGEQAAEDVTFFQTDQFAWESKREGKGHSTKGFDNTQPGLKVLNEGQAAASMPAPAPSTPAPAVPEADATRLQKLWSEGPGKGKPPLTTQELLGVYQREQATKGAK